MQVVPEVLRATSSSRGFSFASYSFFTLLTSHCSAPVAHVGSGESAGTCAGPAAAPPPPEPEPPPAAVPPPGSPFLPAPPVPPPSEPVVPPLPVSGRPPGAALIAGPVPAGPGVIEATGSGPLWPFPFVLVFPRRN